MKIIRKIFLIINKKQKKDFIILQFFMAIEALVELLGITSIVPFMAVASDPSVIDRNEYLKKLKIFFDFENSNQMLIFLGVIVFLLILIGNIFKILMKWYATTFGQHIGKDLGVRLFNLYLQEGYLFHTMNNSSRLTSTIVMEVTRLTNNVIITLLTLNARLLTIIFITLGLIVTDYISTISMVMTLGGSYLLIYYLIKKKIYSNSIEMSHLSSARMQTISEGFGALKELLIYGKERVYVSAYEKISQRYAVITTYNMFYPIVPRYFLEIISLGGVVLAVILIIVNGSTISDSLPILSIFAMAGLKLLPALQQFFSALTTLKANDHALDYLFEELRKPLNRKTIRTKDKYISPKINLNRISFKYPSSKEIVLKEITLTISPNETIAFVGPSGSGKSTLVDILLGLLVPDNGRLEVNDVDIISNEKMEKWQNSIGYVPQTIYLLDSSIASNIAFTLDPNSIDLKRVEQVCKMAMLDDFIKSTPNGYLTYVGENGVQLSGGQRQRIGIARALYDDPSVIVFDEATSALDNKTEKEIMNAIYNLSKNKTIILIAHRLTTVKNCDKIYFMENGSIIDNGSYEELSKSCEQFRKLTLA